MRPLVLYLRSRQVPLALAATIGTVAVLWSLDQATTGTARAHAMLGPLAVLAGSTMAGPGLAGADVDIERTAAIAWPPRRVLHVLAVGATVIGVVAATALTGDRLAPIGQIVRDAVGMSGLVALGAATVGAGRAWIAPLGWTLLAWTLLAMEWFAELEPTYQEVCTWMLQPTGSTAATGTAVVLGLLGALVYAAAGPRP
jgi:hypothetical protein